MTEEVVFPSHPRTRKAINQLGVHLEDHLHLIDPVGYLDMLVLEENARLIATDSGGVQREAYFLGIPCLTLRDETEWVETIDLGWNKLVGAQVERILAAWADFDLPQEHLPIFGDGKAAKRIAQILDQEKITFGRSHIRAQATFEAPNSLYREPTG